MAELYKRMEIRHSLHKMPIVYRIILGNKQTVKLMIWTTNKLEGICCYIILFPKN